MKKSLFTIATYLLAIIFIVFGSNKIVEFVEMPPPSDPEAGRLLGAIFTSYLGEFLGLMEVVGGILLAIPKTSYLGILILAPILLNIMLFHLFHDFPGNPAWMLTIVLGIVVGIRHSDKIKKIVD